MLESLVSGKAPVWLQARSGGPDAFRGFLFERQGRAVLIVEMKQMIGDLIPLFAPKTTNLDTEDAMATSYLVVLLLLPVFLQIILPLIMLAGWGVFRGLFLLFGERQSVEEIAAETKEDEKLQLSRL